MPLAETYAGLTSIKAVLDLAKAMVGLRDAETFRSKSIELQQTILDALDGGIAAREAYSKQLDRISALEAEVASLKAWDAEKQSYELKPVGYGSMAYMLKPEARGAEPPHWLCPNCFAKGQKSFLLPNGNKSGRDTIYACVGCRGTMPVTYSARWVE
jgi:hypothetical protein